MMKTFTALFLLICSYNLSFAQSDFRDGYVVSVAGDTLQGQLNYKESRSNNSSCTFRPNENAATQKLSPDEIQAYGFMNDKAFQVKTIKSLTGESITAFVEVLVRGRLNLYVYQSRFFIEKAPGELTELINTKQETYIDDYTNAMKRSNEHIALLNTLMIDCPNFLDRIESISLSQKSLSALVKDYNNCVAPGESISFKENKKWALVKVGVAASVNAEQLSFSSVDRMLALYENAKFDQTLYPSVGFLLNLVSPRVSERFSFQAEAFVAKYKYTGTSDYVSFSDEFNYENDFKLSVTTLKFNTALRYTFVYKSIKPYINLGMSNKILLKNEAERDLKMTSRWGVEQHKSTETFLSDTHSGAFGGVGLNFTLGNRTLFSEMRYDRGMHIAVPQGSSEIDRRLKSNSDTFSFIAGLYF